jgi:hypothetical protein
MKLDRITFSVRTKTVRSLQLGAVITAGCALIGFGGPRDLSAETKTITIAESLKVAGAPDHAHVAMQRVDGSVAVFPAVIVSIPGKEDVAIVARISADTENPPTKAIISLFGQTGELASHTRDMRDIMEYPELTFDTTELQARVRERRESIKEWEGKVSEQSANLVRLREDADLITNVGRIVSKEDEVEVMRRDSERLRSALVTAQQRVAALQQKVFIPNEQGRFAQLTSELSTLASAVKKSEEQAEQRFSSASSELQEKLALIESTKNDRIDLLKKELEELRKESLSKE